MAFKRFDGRSTLSQWWKRNEWMELKCRMFRSKRITSSWWCTRMIRSACTHKCTHTQFWLTFRLMKNRKNRVMQSTHTISSTWTIMTDLILTLLTWLWPRQRPLLTKKKDTPKFIHNTVSLLPARWSGGMKAKNNRKWPEIFLDFSIVNNSANKPNIRKRWKYLIVQDYNFDPVK